MSSSKSALLLRGQSLPRTISVVIPTLNEAAGLPDTLARIRHVPEVCEIIVVDGGSRDGTADLAAKLGCRVLSSEPGRGRQMRVGAAAATGDVVLLLHADTWVEPGLGRAALNCFHDPAVVGGGFWKVFRGGSLLMRGSRFKCAVRFLVVRRVLGDQAMFIRRDALERIGGVPDVPLMEEFELCRALRRIGKLVLAGSTVSTSARRFEKLGVWRTYARMWRVTLGYYLGVPPAELQRIYERK
ncbi:MAG TPA: TIGR04283 family arsenosugar biosynthesis glycosyltransferase [Verrucomicrobiae bacterium]